MMDYRETDAVRKKRKRKSNSIRTNSKLPEEQRIRKRAEIRRQQEAEEEKRKRKKKNQSSVNETKGQSTKRNKKSTSGKSTNGKSASGKTTSSKNTNSKNINNKNTNLNLKAKKVSLWSWLLWLLQLISCGVLVLCVRWIDIIPNKFLIAMIALMVILAFLAVWLFRLSARKGKVQIPGKVLSVLVIAVCLTGSYFTCMANQAIENVTAKISDEAKTNSLDVTKDGFNVYISGIDVYGDLEQTSRSDVNQIMTINPLTKKILLTTTPRDYYVTIPGITGDEKDKLTHAGNYGVETSIATLENLYGVNIPFYVRVNFTSVIEIVDIMGGVDVESDYAFTTSKAAGEVVDIKKGMNHLNGKQALAFVRERKALEDGDNQRGKDQQALIRALIKKVISPSMIYQANDIINSVAGNVDTNLSEAQLKSLIKMQLNDMADWDIDSVAANGDNQSRQWCYSYTGNTLFVTLVDEESVAEITQKIKDVIAGK